MLRTELWEIVNTGRAWAFIGSGASVDSGCPTWEMLVTDVVEGLDPEIRERVRSNDKYVSNLHAKQFPKCMGVIEELAGRAALEKAVASELGKCSMPGKILQLLTDWPFAGIITTNYDSLIETCFDQSGHRGWIPVGNTPDEIRKVTGDATQVIWHIHGALKLPTERSHLILTDRDYDDLYLEESSVLAQLRSLLSNRRCVFFGFGFEEAEVTRLLKRVGRACNPARPAYAFLSGLSGAERDTERKDLLIKCNIDVIPYRVVDRSHEQLVELLEVYGAFILRRSLSFGQAARACPSYHPETTGLLVYNELCLNRRGDFSAEVIETVLRARVLSLLQHRGQCTLSDLSTDLNERAQAILGRSRMTAELQSNIVSVIKDLSERGLVQRVQDSKTGEGHVTLSAEGADLVSNMAAAARRIEDQFKSSLRSRSRGFLPDESEKANRVALAAETFLKDCARRRALGVGMALYSQRSEYQSYHMVALLQSLPEFMPQLKDASEATALVRLVTDVLSGPSEAEAKYIGLSIQAQFGVHLLAYDPDTLNVRARSLGNTLFLVDSSTLIPFLARSSIGYHSARLLIGRLKDIGATLYTTMYLALEVAEHARWAVERVKSGDIRPRVEALAATMGRSGERSNAFVEGFIEETSRGEIIPNFAEYLYQILQCRSNESPDDEDIRRALVGEGIPSPSLNEWSGFKQEMWEERDSLQREITNLREQRKTFKHERQTKAEAEALMIIRNLRNGEFDSGCQRVGDAYFISHTRVIDDVAGHSVRVTMRPEAALQWVATLKPCTLEELSYLFNGLLWELSERDLSIVDKARLQRAFAPLLDASKSKLQEMTGRHGVLISETYGVDSLKAFDDADLLDKPIIFESLSAQTAEKLALQLQEETQKRVAAESVARISEKERLDLQRLKMKEKQREQEARRKRLAALNRKRKKQKKKRRK